MGQALYRRYRSKNLAEIVGQEHITRTLDNTLKRGAIGHAYLLTGPRGVGKTSIARILAHEINELPYQTEQVHLDIIEIDAASNRRIDEIRDLRDKVHIAPSSAKYKVYIIDEVHMLTKEAFNALLKTLEEPPEHVIFILATTDVHKLPETIISRTQHFTFKPIPVVKIVNHLQAIAKKEKINIEPDALTLIAEHGNGSFRDSIGLLEQATGLSDKVTAGEVRHMLGVPPKELITELVGSFIAGDAKQLIASLQDLYKQGFLAEEVAAQFSAQLRTLLINNELQGVNQPATLIKELVEVPASRDPESLLEIVILKYMNFASTQKNTDRQSPTKAATPPTKPKKSIATDSKTLSTEKVEAKPEPKKASTEEPTILNDDVWEHTLQKLKTSYSTLYSIARMADFSTNGTEITLRFKFPFHKKRMEASKHKTVLTTLLEEKLGNAPIVNYELADTTKPTSSQVTQKHKEASENHPLEAISNIFGGAEVLES